MRKSNSRYQAGKSLTLLYFIQSVGRAAGVQAPSTSPINIHLSKSISKMGKLGCLIWMGKFRLADESVVLNGEWPWSAIRSSLWNHVLRRMCLCCVRTHSLAGISSLIVSYDLSRLYNSARLSNAFIENENKWEFFISSEIEASEISLRFRVFFRCYLSNEITRIKIIFQIVDGAIIRGWDLQLSCFVLLLCVDMKNGKTTKQNFKGQICCFQADESAEIPPGSVASLPSAEHSYATVIYFRLQTPTVAAILRAALKLISMAKIIIGLQYIKTSECVWFSVDIFSFRRRSWARRVNK